MKRILTPSIEMTRKEYETISDFVEFLNDVRNYTGEEWWDLMHGFSFDELGKMKYKDDYFSLKVVDNELDE